MAQDWATGIPVDTTSADARQLRTTLIRAGESPYRRLMVDYLRVHSIEFDGGPAHVHVHVISHEGMDVEGIETQADSQAAADAVLHAAAVGRRPRLLVSRLDCRWSQDDGIPSGLAV